eukprot:7172224-Heterocapsa_arctica.AAC.1
MKLPTPSGPATCIRGRDQRRDVGNPVALTDPAIRPRDALKPQGLSVRSTPAQYTSAGKGI